MYTQLVLVFSTAILGCLIQQTVTKNPRDPVRFTPLQTDREIKYGDSGIITSRAYCIKWAEIVAGDGSCLEVNIKINLVRECDTKYIDFFVPCDLNIVQNSFVDFWTLRAWDYLYSSSASEYIFMRSDGTCLKKVFRVNPDTKTKVEKNSVLSATQCKAEKESVTKESGELDSLTIEKTWFELSREEVEELSSNKNKEKKDSQGTSPVLVETKKNLDSSTAIRQTSQQATEDGKDKNTPKDKNEDVIRGREQEKTGENDKTTDPFPACVSSKTKRRGVFITFSRKHLLKVCQALVPELRSTNGNKIKS